MDLIANAPSIVDGGCFNQAMLIAMRVSSSNRCTHNQLGERFWGCRAPIIKFRRISNPAYTRRSKTSARVKQQVPNDLATQFKSV